MFFPAADTIAFAEGGAEAMRIDSAGNVGIGTASPNVRLHISGANTLLSSTDGMSTTTDLNPLALEIVNTSTTTDTYNQIILETGAAHQAYIRGVRPAAAFGSDIAFLRRSGASTIAESMRIDSSGNLGLGVTPSAWNSAYKVLQLNTQPAVWGSSDALFLSVNQFQNTSGSNRYIANGFATQYRQDTGQHQFYTAASGTAGNAITFTQAMTLDASGGLQTLNTIGVGNATPSTSGAGITFPATQSASTDANTLDDYEEGTWTPVAKGTTTAGTGTYSLQEGRYTKIGRVCIFQFTLGWSAHTGTGALRFDGLPFTALSGIAGQSAATLGYNSGLAFTNQPVMYISSTLVTPSYSTTTGGISTIPMDTSVAELIINGHYIVA
jgi:hypothetical protein